MSNVAKNPAAFSDDIFPGGITDFVSAYEARGFLETYTYDSVAAYTIVYVFMKNLQYFLRSKDVTDEMLETFLRFEDDAEYESIRRELFKNRIQETIYGPVSFDSNQQNNGRGPGNVYVGAVEDSWGVLQTSAPQSVRDVIPPWPSPGARPCPSSKSKWQTRRLDAFCARYACRAPTLSSLR